MCQVNFAYSIRAFHLLLIVGFLSSSLHHLCAQDVGILPICKKEIQRDSFHDTLLLDPYAWLEDPNNPEVLRYIDAENQYAQGFQRQTVPLQKKLARLSKKRNRKNQQYFPLELGPYWYYAREKAWGNFPLLCRKKGSWEEPEVVILDLNKLYKELQFASFNDFMPSPNGAILAFLLDKTGNGQLDLHIKKLQKDEILQDEINDISSIVWANDNQHLYYTKNNPTTHRSFQLYRHKIGTQQQTDQLLYEENDSLFNLHLRKSKSNAYIFLESSSYNQNEYYYFSADSLVDSLQLFEQKEVDHLYHPYHHQNQFFILSNQQNQNKLYRCNPKRTPQEYWQPFWENNYQIAHLDIFKNFLLVVENHDSRYQIRIIPLADTTQSSTLLSTSNALQVELLENYNYEANHFNYNAIYFNAPDSVFQFEVGKQQRQLVYTEVMPRHFSAAKYTAEKRFAKAPDGQRIPISILYRNDLKKPSGNPLIIEAYGAYGEAITPYFDANRLNLLNQGFIYAIAHVRGGNEMGPKWYQQGKLLQKKNSFTDFISAVEFLMTEGYTSHEKVVAKGSSAGGMLVAAATNMRPDLFKLVILEYPFVDVINTMMNPQLPLTIEEYEEWGNPNEEKYFDYMLSYSPYNNIKAQNYPHMLFYGALLDQRVPYWEPLKMVAKLRSLKTDNNFLLMRTFLYSGHDGPNSIIEEQEKELFEQAFILSLFGQWD